MQGTVTLRGAAASMARHAEAFTEQPQFTAEASMVAGPTVEVDSTVAADAGNE